MESYTNVTVCLNGHIVSKYIRDIQKYCSYCGTETYSYCPYCACPIMGMVETHNDLVNGIPRIKTYYCCNCANPYPWTEKILNQAVELLALDEDLDKSSKELIKNAIPDLLVETPTTPIAIAKYEKGILKSSGVLADCMRQLLISTVCEVVKKSLFP